MDLLERQALQPQRPFGFFWAQERGGVVSPTEGRCHLLLFSQMSHPQISFSLKIKLLCTMLQREIVFQDLTSWSDGMEQEATQFK